ncbi:TrmH family RNA methyltransferase [Bdellovibrionales bacterium]|nr:TrmH family RNA methyltransferase [Bdellovibrionales bacterium]
MKPTNALLKWQTLSKKRQLELLWRLTNKVISNPLKNLKGENSEWLKELSAKIALYENHKDCDLKRLFSLHKRLLKEPSLKKLTDFSISLERLCNIDSVESDFLVTSEDQLPSRALKNPLYLILENIRSAFNVGTILRTADCLGVTEILFVGYTPTPDSPGVKKSALGAEERVPWRLFSNLKEAALYLETNHIPMVALETTQNSLSLFNYKFDSSVAFLLGNERFGLSHEALTKAPITMEIPTFGYKNSLNVSHAFAIAGYEALRQWKGESK